TAAIRSSAVTLSGKSTVACSVAKFTVATTPSTWLSRFSTRVAHDAHDIPPTARVSSRRSAAVAAVVLAAGCGGGDSGSQHPVEHGSSTTASSPDHNDTDAGFVESMIPHH